jgi:hypothetical protein
MMDTAGAGCSCGAGPAGLRPLPTRWHRPARRRGAIRLAQVEELDPVFAPDELGPTLEAEVHLLGSGSGVRAGTGDTEAWILSVLAKRAEGSSSGTTTGGAWARRPTSTGT